MGDTLKFPSYAIVLPTGEKTLQNLEDAVSIKEMLANVLDIPLDTFICTELMAGEILVFSVQILL